MFILFNFIIIELSTILHLIITLDALRMIYWLSSAQLSKLLHPVKNSVKDLLSSLNLVVNLREICTCRKNGRNENFGSFGAASFLQNLVFPLKKRHFCLKNASVDFLLVLVHDLPSSVISLQQRLHCSWRR